MGGGDPYHDELGRFTDGPSSGAAGGAAKKIAKDLSSAKVVQDTEVGHVMSARGRTEGNRLDRKQARRDASTAHMNVGRAQVGLPPLDRGTLVRDEIKWKNSKAGKAALEAHEESLRRDAAESIRPRTKKAKTAKKARRIKKDSGPSEMEARKFGPKKKRGDPIPTNYDGKQGRANRTKIVSRTGVVGS